jgi:hypothetical protein
MESVTQHSAQAEVLFLCKNATVDFGRKPMVSAMQMLVSFEKNLQSYNATLNKVTKFLAV